MKIDVLAISWQAHQLLIGECKWGGQTITQSVVRELVEQRIAKLVKQMELNLEQWHLHPLFFARSGFTVAAKAYAYEQGIQLINLEQMMTLLNMPPDRNLMG